MTTRPLPGLESQPAGIVWVPSPNFWAGRGQWRPIAIVHHVMLGTLAGTDQEFTRGINQTSAHFGVGQDGTIHQYVHVLDSAWANGGVKLPNLAAVPWIKPYCQDQGINANRLTISIEWEGQHTHATWTRVPWAGGTVATMARTPPPTFWVPPPAQYAAGLALTRWLAATWAIALDREHLCRHSDFDSVTRWFCPGEGFPMARLITDLGGVV